MYQIGTNIGTNNGNRPDLFAYSKRKEITCQDTSDSPHEKKSDNPTSEEINYAHTSHQTCQIFKNT